MKLKHLACLAAVPCLQTLGLGWGSSSLQVRRTPEYWSFASRLSCEVWLTSEDYRGVFLYAA